MIIMMMILSARLILEMMASKLWTPNSEIVSSGSVTDTFDRRVQVIDKDWKKNNKEMASFENYCSLMN